MAYTLIATQTLLNPTYGVTFSNIPQTFKDLYIEISGTNSSDGQNVYAQLNGDTGANYSYTRITGNGTAAASSRSTGGTYLVLSDFGTTVNSSKINIMQYANTNVYKTVLENGGIASYRVTAYVNLWRSTAAVTSVYLFSASGNLATGTLKLWGVS